jgi:uncharacterized protein YjbI with pentapeptide repeats
MANQEHIDILKQGVEIWNQGRKREPDILPDLSLANLSGANLKEIDLWKADLSAANFYKANLQKANLRFTHLNFASLSQADLRGAHLNQANLSTANLSQADLRGADLSEALLRAAALTKVDLRGARLIGTLLMDVDLTNANLMDADLKYANLVRTDLTDAILSGCWIYGISVWDTKLQGTKQENLLITLSNRPTVRVDNLKVAQFIYLLLDNQEIRDVIDTIAKKAVLILGRFTPERKAILEAIREMLRQKGYLPILFDFDKPASRDITETVSTLAHLSRFVIADITDAKSIPQELMMIVPNLPSVPVQPLILSSQHEYGMFEHFTRFPWVLPVYRYVDQESLLQSLQENVIAPAEQRAKELAKR